MISFWRAARQMGHQTLMLANFRGLSRSGTPRLHVAVQSRNPMRCRCWKKFSRSSSSTRARTRCSPYAMLMGISAPVTTHSYRRSKLDCKSGIACSGWTSETWIACQCPRSTASNTLDDLSWRADCAEEPHGTEPSAVDCLRHSKTRAVRTVPSKG